MVRSQDALPLARGNNPPTASTSGIIASFFSPRPTPANPPTPPAHSLPVWRKPNGSTPPPTAETAKPFSPPSWPAAEEKGVHSRIGELNRSAPRTTQVGLHSILSFTHEDYGRATSLRSLAAQLSWGSASGSVPDEYYLPADQLGNHPDTLLTRRANATLLMLARNSDVKDAVRSVRRLEDRFNKKFGYPWVFLNEEPFSEEFKTCVCIPF
uniref:Glycolipid 2-alpha-mannosyltransferase n=1 Tax=Ganoderma boninense TaxID=34458 RepID=A0A5K1JUX5_9APHY|nr:Glycolipid 2-alpha-mannosyltransferase [Ganoderma boninense]